MSIIVLKFGGTSVADTSKIKHVATKIKAEWELGNKVAVVVSAMAGVTNTLIEYCLEVSSLGLEQNLTEYDAAISHGEVVTAALTALALQNLGLRAKSFQAWQLPISTNNSYSRALVTDINTELLLECFDQGIIPIVAGFQGVNHIKRITTLGRGGSDTSATALAAALKASRCDIYTDVDGVFTSDPRLVSNAQKIDYLSYEEMLEFASMGAKVLHHRSVQIAKRYSIPIRVLSTFQEGNGTIITFKEKIMETAKITGVAYNHNIALITIYGLKNYPESFIPIYKALSDRGINIDTLVHHYDYKTASHSVIFTILLSDIGKIETFKSDKSLNKLYDNIDINSEVVIVSLIGHGIKADNNIIHRTLDIVSQSKLDVYLTYNSEIKLSLVVDNSNTEILIRNLHNEFICKIKELV